MLRSTPVFLVTLLSCASVPHPAQELASEPVLEGNWEWTETAGGKMGSTRGPKSEGYSLRLTFGVNHRFVIRKDAEAWVTGLWEVENSADAADLLFRLDADPPSATPMSLRGLGDPPRHRFWIDASGSLVLDEGCCDRYRHIFRRMP